MQWGETTERTNCSRIDELIQAWECTGRLSEEELVRVSEHVGQCRRCALAYGALIPLLGRDAGRPAGLFAPSGQLSERFTAGLMQRVAGGGRSGRLAHSARRRHMIRLPLALATGVVLFVAAGFLVWLWGFQSRGILVHFELAAPEARSVNLVGNFSGWDPNRLAMKDVTSQGDWRITIRLKRGRVYTYNFLMDGQRWITDPNVPHQVDDGFGGTNSVLQL